MSRSPERSGGAPPGDRKMKSRSPRPWATPPQSALGTVAGLLGGLWGDRGDAPSAQMGAVTAREVRLVQRSGRARPSLSWSPPRNELPCRRQQHLAPPPARQGFTAGPVSNCGHELGRGLLESHPREPGPRRELQACAVAQRRRRQRLVNRPRRPRVLLPTPSERPAGRRPVAIRCAACPVSSRKHPDTHS